MWCHLEASGLCGETEVHEVIQIIVMVPSGLCGEREVHEAIGK